MTLNHIGKIIIINLNIDFFNSYCIEKIRILMQSRMNNTKMIRNLKYEIHFSLANNIQIEIINVNYKQL